METKSTKLPLPSDIVNCEKILNKIMNLELNLQDEKYKGAYTTIYWNEYGIDTCTCVTSITK